MRAVQIPARRRLPAHWGARTSQRSTMPKPHSVRTDSRMGLFIAYAAAFLLGYLPGLLAGRGGQNDLGQQLAAYYTDTIRLSTWSQAFSGQMSAAFLQLLVVILCGFSVFGSVFLTIFFAARGSFFGFCAANVLAGSGVQALALYWVTDCLPGLLVLFVCLRLACHAVQLSSGLFKSTFGGGAPRGQVATAARKLLVRGGAAILTCGLLSVLGAGLDIFIVSVFLRN